MPIFSPLQLAVVGHTNTGKTSLLRTLLRDDQFGEVSHQAATTRHVERASLEMDGQPLIWIYDTPGLEDAGGLMEWLETQTSHREEGIQRLQTFLASAAAESEFSQEAKVIRQVIDSDMALYLIDAREPIVGKYRDELSILSLCAQPVMPVFNFCQQGDLRAWREMLARRTLHVSTAFDTVAFDFEGEMQLWDNLATMLPVRDALDRWIAHRRQDWQRLEEEALRQIAHFLLEIAAFSREIPDNEDTGPTLASMQEQVRQRERQLHQELLSLYRFYHSTINPEELTLRHREQDPFDPELLRAHGIKTGSAMAAGATVGMGIDAMALGTTLGMGAVIGGLIGGILPNTRLLSDKISGIKRLQIDDATLTVLAARNLSLLDSLRQRGHAAQSAIVLGQGRAPWAKTAQQAGALPTPLRRARGKPEWSALNTHRPAQAHLLREDMVGDLITTLSH